MHKYVLSLFLSIVVFFMFVVSVAAQVQEDEYFYLPDERTLMDAGTYDQAKASFEKSLKQSVVDKNNRDTAKYTKNLADTYLRTSDYKKALELYQQANDLLVNVDDKKLQRSIVHNIGVAYVSQGLYDQAEEYYLKALKIAEEINYNYGLISEYNNLANLYFNKADYTKATEYFEKALKYAKESNIKEYELSVLGNLANVYNFTGKFDLAKKQYEQVLEVAKSYSDKTLYADTLHNLATLNTELGNYDEAVSNLENVIEIYKENKDKKKLSQAYSNLGVTLIERSVKKLSYEKLDVLDKALEAYNMSLDLSLEINAIDTALTTFRQIRNVRTAIFSACQENMQEAKKLRADLDSLSSNLSNLEKDDITKDIELIESTSTMCKDVDVIKILKDEVEVDEKLLKYAKELQYNSLIPSTLINLANDYYALGDVDTSIEKLKEAVSLKEKYSNPDLWHTYYLLGLTYEDGLKNKVLALEAYDKAIIEVKNLSNNILNQADRKAYIDQKQELFQKAANLLFEKGSNDEARDLIEYSKLSEQGDYFALGFLNKKGENLTEQEKLAKESMEALKTLTEVSSSLSEEKVKKTEEQNPDKIKLLREELQKARQDFQQMAITLQQEYPELLKYVAVKPSNIRTVQAKLPEDTVIIEPIIIENTEDNVKKFKMITFIGPPGKALPKYIKKDLGEFNLTLAMVKFRKAIYEKDLQKIQSISKELYDVLIEPIKDDISPYKVLIISPYENLRYIPFQALYDGEKYLVEKFAIVNATSSSGLKFADQSSLKHDRLLAFGNPTDNLPAAEEEVNIISEKFKKPKVFLKSAATIESFNEEVYNDYDVIHLATHGVLNNTNPENSQLLFADKGSLNVGEIMGYDFSEKNLIVLSACDSVIGISKGAEVSALGTAFELASAPSVIASLWKVDDNSTALMMQFFYQYYTAGETKATSLRKAQLDLIKSKQFSNPYYWAPFVLLGEWN